MILNHIADGPCLIVESTSTLNTEVLRHRDLNAFDIVTVPERLEQRVCEPEVQNILNRPFPEVVVNPEYRLFREGADQDPVQFPSRDEVSTKGLFNDNS